MFDFIFLNGVEELPGDTYVSTREMPVLGEETKVVFGKTTYRTDLTDVILLPEIHVDSVDETTYTDVLREFLGTRKSDFYAIRAPDGHLEVVAIGPSQSAISFSPLKIGRADIDK